jgi:hypothetical protein
MADVADMCTLNGSDITGGIPFGSPSDVRSHADTRLPSPGFGPAMVHGTGMAGSQAGLKNPAPMTQMR